MDNSYYDINVLRNIILDSQHLLEKSSDSIEKITSDICGLQYDPNPTIHLNQYMVLWNRIKDFKAEDLDIAAYKDFRVVETWTFKRNMFFVPRDEYSLYKHATKGILRWGSSDEGWLKWGDSPETREAENELKEKLSGFDGLTLNQIWENLGLSYEWHKYRREHDHSYELPLFRAFNRMCRKGDFLVCGRNPGTFREPVYILREKVGFSDWTEDDIDDKQAVKRVVEKLIASFGITDPVHISHISGYKSSDLRSIFEELEEEKKIQKLSQKIGRKYYYIHSSKTDSLNEKPFDNSDEVRLISPMDAIVRDKAWLEAFFDYSFTFEYFKKKGMKWPLSILVGNQFVGYIDCKMDWKTGKLIIKEKNIYNPDFTDYKGIELAIQDLAYFHGAKEIVERCKQK